MKTRTKGAASLTAVAILVILGGALMLVTACNNQQEAQSADPAGSDAVPEAATVIDREVANDWIVVHQRRKPGSSVPGGSTDLCEAMPKREIAHLPEKCMLVEPGDKIGFANYYNDYVTGQSGGDAVTFELPASMFDCEEPVITLAYQETRILTVENLPPGPVVIHIKHDGDHGGPTIVPVQPPN